MRIYDLTDDIFSVAQNSSICGHFEFLFSVLHICRLWRIIVIKLKIMNHFLILLFASAALFATGKIFI